MSNSFSAPSGLNSTEPCPSCGKPARLTAYAHTVRRGDKAIAVTWHMYACEQGCRSERNGEPFAFVNLSVSDENRAATDAAWREKYGESLPAPLRGGRPPRAGTPSTERVPILFTRDELDDIDRRRGDLSRSAFVRQAALGHR